MKCEEVQEQLLAGLDQNAESPSHSDLESHLAGCPACREEWQSMRELSARLSALPQEQPSPAVRARFESTLEAFRQGMAQGETRLAVAGPRKTLPGQLATNRLQEISLWNLCWERLRPFRFNAGGLAAVCLVIAGFKLATPRPTAPAATAQAVAPSPQVRLALQEQRRLLDELIAPTRPVVDQKPSAHPQPRSERPDSTPPPNSADIIHPPSWFSELV